jgi:hypothetical protein
MAGTMNPETLDKAMFSPQNITINSALELEKDQVRSGISEAVRKASHMLGVSISNRQLRAPLASVYHMASNKP